MKNKNKEIDVSDNIKILFLICSLIALVGVLMLIDAAKVVPPKNYQINITEGIEPAANVFVCRGDYTELSSTLPNESIRGRIMNFNYEIDKILLLKISNESKLPIVCGKDYDYDFYAWNDGYPGGKKCDKRWNADHIKQLINLNEKNRIVCCVENYCAEWGNEYKYYNCTCIKN